MIKFKDLSKPLKDVVVAVPFLVFIEALRFFFFNLKIGVFNNFIGLFQFTGVLGVFFMFIYLARKYW